MSEKKKKDKLDELKEKFPMYASDGFFKKPAVKVVIGAGIVLGALYVSKYFLNAAAGTIRAFKNARNAVKE